MFCAAVTASKFTYDLLPAPLDLDYDSDLCNTQADGNLMIQVGIMIGLSLPF